MIAHRLATVRAADEIAVIDDGRVLERGTHDELVAAGGLYARLSRTQFADAPWWRREDEGGHVEGNAAIYDEVGEVSLRSIEQRGEPLIVDAVGERPATYLGVEPCVDGLESRNACMARHHRVGERCVGEPVSTSGSPSWNGTRIASAASDPKSSSTRAAKRA